MECLNYESSILLEERRCAPNDSVNRVLADQRKIRDDHIHFYFEESARDLLVGGDAKISTARARGLLDEGWHSVDSDSADPFFSERAHEPTFAATDVEDFSRR